MGGILLRELGDEQRTLLRQVFEPFSREGDWPVWQFADISLRRRGLLAGDVLASLPVAGGDGATRMHYGLTWHNDHLLVPNAGTRIALTVAGLWHIRPDGVQLLMAFMETVRYLAKRLEAADPSPFQVVEVTVSSMEVARHLAGAGVPAVSGPAAEITIRKVGQLLEHEPYLWNGFMRPDPGRPDAWSLRITPVLRDFSDLQTPADYVEQVEELVQPPVPPTVPPTAGPLDIPFAIGYLDAVWKAKTGSRLFVNVDPASAARLALACDDDGDFNSLMSALSDVLGQVVQPGESKPSQRGALEKIRDWLVPQLDGDAAVRVSEAFESLIGLRHIRVSQQHADARHKAVEAFRTIGLPFPPPGWDYAWTHIVASARGALDVIREEVHAGMPDA